MRWVVLFACACVCATACTGSSTPSGSLDLSAGPSEVDRSPGHTRKKRPRPNILMIVTDDQRAEGTLEVMLETSRWLERGGTRFTHAYATTPLCCPSRASILTGKYAHNHRIHTNYDPRPLDTRSTIPCDLGREGYRTSIVGKYLNSWPVENDPPCFDRWAIEDAYAYYDTSFNIDGEMQLVSRYSTDFMTGHSARLMRSFERADKKPWLLYVAPLAPHEPFTPAPRHVDAPVPARRLPPKERDISDKPDFVAASQIGSSWMRTLRRRQLRSLLAVDEMVGAFRRQLRELDEEKDTIVVFTSDNGYLWGEHGIGEKRTPYGQSARIPLLVRWPGVLEEGATDDRLVANVDIAPTVLEAAGGRVGRSRFDGRSLLGDHQRERLLLEYWTDPARPEIPSWRSLVDTSSQYTEYRDERGEIVFREYFDLGQDRRQHENLLEDASAQNDPDVRSLSRALKELARCRGASCP